MWRDGTHQTDGKNKLTADERRLNNLTEQIIGCAYRVSNVLGSGFLEKVYENALVLELRKSGNHIEQQKEINVFYEGSVVGEYFADLIVEIGHSRIEDRKILG